MTERIFENRMPAALIAPLAQGDDGVHKALACFDGEKLQHMPPEDVRTMHRKPVMLVGAVIHDHPIGVEHQQHVREGLDHLAMSAHVFAQRIRVTLPVGDVPAHTHQTDGLAFGIAQRNFQSIEHAVFAFVRPQFLLELHRFGRREHLCSRSLITNAVSEGYSSSMVRPMIVAASRLNSPHRALFTSRYFPSASLKYTASGMP